MRSLATRRLWHVFLIRSLGRRHLWQIFWIQLPTKRGLWHVFWIRSLNGISNTFSETNQVLLVEILKSGVRRSNVWGSGLRHIVLAAFFSTLAFLFDLMTWQSGQIKVFLTAGSVLGSTMRVFCSVARQHKCSRNLALVKSYFLIWIAMSTKSWGLLFCEISEKNQYISWEVQCRYLVSSGPAELVYVVYFSVFIRCTSGTWAYLQNPTRMRVRGERSDSRVSVSSQRGFRRIHLALECILVRFWPVHWAAEGQQRLRNIARY